MIDGKATSTASAKNINMTGGDIFYPTGGLTIDLSVPDTETGNGGSLDFTGPGGTSTFSAGAGLKIYTQGSNASGGMAKTGGAVNITFSSNTLMSGASLIKTGNTNVAGVNGGIVDLTGSGNIGVEGSGSLISTSSSRKAGNVKVTGSGYFKGGIHANSCENFGGCGQIGGTIDLTGLDNYYAPDCSSTVLEAKNGGRIDWTGSGFFDLPPTTATGPGGTLKVTGATLSDCSCQSTGGACWTQLGINNATRDFTGEDCNESNPLAACSGTAIDVPSILDITLPNGNSVMQGDVFGITYSLNDPDDVATANLYFDSDNNNSNGIGTPIGSCIGISESAGAICNWNTASAAPGVYYVYGVASDGANDYSPGTITINTGFNYSIAQPDDIVLIPGLTIAIDIDLAQISGTDQNVGLSTNAAPADVNFTWTAGSSCAPDCAKTLTIDVGASPAPGTYPIIITGSSPGLADQTVTFNLTILGVSQSGNLEGFAWSDTAGWISFSSKDCDANNNGFIDGGLCGGDDSTDAVTLYGVEMDLDTNNLSGYAWSDNVGWITFGNGVPGDADYGDISGCPSGTCQPRLDVDEFKGWARACSVFSNGCAGPLKPPTETGGWDGWISLNCSNTGSCLVANPPIAASASDYKVSYTAPNLSGWAWGSEVTGWISFDGVRIRLGDNKPILTISGQTPINYCVGDLPGAVKLQWNFNDFEDDATFIPQTAYEMELTRSDALVCAPGKILSPSTSITGTFINETLCSSVDPEFIKYGGFTYSWELRVFDSDNNANTGSADGFLDGDDFPFDSVGNPPIPTPNHQFPIANFSVDPAANWLALMPITFDPFDPAFPPETRSFGGTTIDLLEWDFDDGEIRPDPAVPIDPDAPGDHKTTKSDYAEGVYTVDLHVKDSSGYDCWASDRNNQKVITIGTNKPKWNEAAP